MPTNYPDDRFYHRDALWLQCREGDEALVGVSHHAQESLGRVVFVDLPRVGTTVRVSEPLGTIESNKAVSDLVSPASGVVVAVNTRLRADPELVNRQPYGDGWLLRIRLATPKEAGQLLDAAGYMAHIGGAS